MIFFEEVKNWIRQKKVIHEDRNFGTLEEVNAFVASKLHKYPNAKWELYVIEKVNFVVLKK